VAALELNSRPRRERVASSARLGRLERRRADDDVAATTTSGAVHMHSSSAATSNRIQLAGCLTATPLRARETYEAGVRSRRTRIVCASAQEATPSTGVEVKWQSGEVVMDEQLRAWLRVLIHPHVDLPTCVLHRRPSSTSPPTYAA
jgi:hypothetical protein